MKIEGARITRGDSWWLVEHLRYSGRAVDAIVARGLEEALATGDALGELLPAEKDAVLQALIDPPAGLLELRSVLARDRIDRMS